MRLIDADALVTKYGDYYVEEGPEDGFIGTLKCLVDMQPTIGGWISVEDRLPDKQPCEYLVVNANNVETAICLDNRWITPRRVTKITHWMPLPEPPEVKQNG